MTVGAPAAPIRRAPRPPPLVPPAPSARALAASGLRYALVELPADQFWFFGVPPNRFLHFRNQLFSERHLLPAVLAPLAAAVGLVGWMRRQPAVRPVGVVLAGAMVYAALSCVGYFGYCSLHYLNPAPIGEIYDRWIAKFEKPRLKALGGLKRRLEKANG